MLFPKIQNAYQFFLIIQPNSKQTIILSNYPHYLIRYHIELNRKEVSIILRKNIIISEEHLGMIEPILQKHNNNLSAAMRDIIEYTGFTLNRYESFEQAKDVLDKGEGDGDSIYDVTIPLSMFKWLITSRDGKMPSLEEVKQLFISQMFTEIEIEGLIKSINEQNKAMHWPLFIKCHVDKSKLLYIIITGVDKTINKFEAILLTQYLATLEDPYVLSDIVILPTSIQIQYVKGTKEMAQESMLKHFEASTKI